MARIETEVIEELLAQIDALKNTIQTAGDEGRKRLGDIKVKEVRDEVPFASDGKVDETEWSKRPQAEQEKLHQRLTLVRDSLQAAAGHDGPTDPKHIMYGEYASNTGVVAWAVIGFSVTALLLWAILSLWNTATGTDFARQTQTATVALTEALTELEEARSKLDEIKEASRKAQVKAISVSDDKTRKDVEQEAQVLARNEVTGRGVVVNAEKKAKLAAVGTVQAIEKGGATEGVVLTMVVLLGALGGSLHLVGSLVKFVGNRQLKRSWMLYYLAMPITGAGLAAIVYMLLRVGILNPSGVSADGSGVANLNLIAIYAFSALTGLFAKTALEKLGEVFRTIFRTSERPSKDALGAQKPPGGTAPAAGKS
jgi:low affinity Fe/Cu permease